NVTELLCTLAFRLKQYGNWRFTGSPAPLLQEPGAMARASGPFRYASGYSPWPRLMPPESVPALLKIRLLAICRLCPHPCTKMPPPPWELLVTLRASMLDGLHWKLLGYGL